jgi:peptide/nickel transport system permease protein
MATVSPTATSSVSVAAPRPREKGTSLTRDALRRLRRNKLAMAGLIVVIFLGLLAIFADVIAPYPYTKTNFGRLTEAPSRDYPLGTDQIGRDLLSRVIYGGRVSLLIGTAAVLVSSTIGVLLGLAAGYFAGRVDWTIMTLVNVMLTFPFVLLALAVIAVLGPSLINMIIVLGVADWPLYARVIRAETLAIREREFVLAGRALGMSHFRIVFRQILPNLISVIVVIATLQVARVIILESFLSFLGLGVQPPTPAWGNMLGEGRVYMLNSWWIATFPGLAIFVTTLAINLMGDALRDWLDPHMKV